MKWMPCHVGSAVCAAQYPGAYLALPSAAVNAAKASTEPMLISLMLEVADGHTRLQVQPALYGWLR
jgi:hypothetical protein